MEGLNERIARLNKDLDAVASTSPKEAEQTRIDWLGRKGIITELFESFREVSPEEKRKLGKPLNELKKKAEHKIKTLKEQSDNSIESDGFDVDPTRPVHPFHATTGTNQSGDGKDHIHFSARWFHSFGGSGDGGRLAQLHGLELP